MADDRKIIMAVDLSRMGPNSQGKSALQYRGIQAKIPRLPQPEIQTPVIQWPDATSGGLEGATSDKVPTEIQYEGQNFKWGFQIADYGQRHQWFKLGLDPAHCQGASSALARDYPDANAAPPDYHSDAEKMVTDYLTALRIHAEKILRWKLPESALHSTPIEFIITTPAVWSDLAQTKTRSCAQKAGMGSGSQLHIISEPEAAAMYALDAMDPHNIKIGDTFVLCDAGGGTVDLISYKVAALKPVLKISEAAPGSGSTCGSTFLNRIFQKFLKDKLGEDPYWDDEVLEEAMKRFDVTVKRSFSGQQGEEYQIPVPGLRDSVLRDVRRGRYRLTGPDVQKIFDPIVKEVTALVLGQITATKASVKAVLLVGGFGQNTFLRDSIRQAVAPLGIEVMQSPNGWTAVVRGALMKGLASSDSSFARVNVSGRKARKHYGLLSRKRYNQHQHADIAHLREWADFEGEYRIGTMDWYIEKGTDVEEDKPKMFPYYRRYHAKEGPPNEMTTIILVCGDPNNTGPPKLMNSEVNRLVKVTIDFSQVPHRGFKTIMGRDGQRYYKVEYGIQMTCYSAYTKFELVYNGRNYGPVTAEYV